MIYEELIPADHLLGRLAAGVDFGVARQLVSHCYCPGNGRPSWDILALGDGQKALNCFRRRWANLADWVCCLRLAFKRAIVDSSLSV